MVRSVDSAKFMRLVQVVRLAPHLRIPDAMKLAKNSDEEVSDLSFWRLLQHRLHGRSMDSFRAILFAEAAPARNRDERLQQRAIERTPLLSVPPPY